jgi:lipoate-protein ligase A
MAGALCSLGVDARVGEVPGEFCSGPHSVNAGGRTKLVGTAQRIVRGGFLFAASVVVRDPEPVRAVLVDVYAALGLDWDPRTVGSVADSVPPVTVAEVEEALAEAFAARHELVPGDLDGAALEAARARLERHAVAV